MWRPSKVPPAKTDEHDARNPKWYIPDPHDGAPEPTKPPPTQAQKPKHIEPIPHPDHSPDTPEMKEFGKIFNWMLKETADRCHAINDAIDGKGDYDDAVRRYNEFLDGINDQDPKSTHNGPTMNWAVIEPVMSLDGFIIGARVKAKWLGGTHSSSSGVAIIH